MLLQAMVMLDVENRNLEQHYRDLLDLADRNKQQVPDVLLREAESLRLGDHQPDLLDAINKLSLHQPHNNKPKDMNDEVVRMMGGREQFDETIRMTLDAWPEFKKHAESVESDGLDMLMKSARKGNQDRHSVAAGPGGPSNGAQSYPSGKSAMEDFDMSTHFGGSRELLREALLSVGTDTSKQHLGSTPGSASTPVAHQGSHPAVSTVQSYQSGPNPLSLSGSHQDPSLPNTLAASNASNPAGATNATFGNTISYPHGASQRAGIESALGQNVDLDIDELNPGASGTAHASTPTNPDMTFLVTAETQTPDIDSGAHGSDETYPVLTPEQKPGTLG